MKSLLHFDYGRVDEGHGRVVPAVVRDLPHVGRSGVGDEIDGVRGFQLVFNRSLWGRSDLMESLSRAQQFLLNDFEEKMYLCHVTGWALDTRVSRYYAERIDHPVLSERGLQVEDTGIVSADGKVTGYIVCSGRFLILVEAALSIYDSGVGFCFLMSSTEMLSVHDVGVGEYVLATRECDSMRWAFSSIVNCAKNRGHLVVNVYSLADDFEYVLIDFVRPVMI